MPLICLLIVHCLMFIYIFLNELGSDNDRIDSCLMYKLGNWYAPKFISRHCIVSEKPKDKPKKEEPVYDKNCKDYLPAAVCAIQNCKKNNSYKKVYCKKTCRTCTSQ